MAVNAIAALAVVAQPSACALAGFASAPVLVSWVGAALSPATSESGSGNAELKKTNWTTPFAGLII